MSLPDTVSPADLKALIERAEHLRVREQGRIGRAEALRIAQEVGVPADLLMRAAEERTAKGVERQKQWQEVGELLTGLLCATGGILVVVLLGSWLGWINLILLVLGAPVWIPLLLMVSVVAVTGVLALSPFWVPLWLFNWLLG